MSNEQLTQMIGAAVMDYILETEDPTADEAWFKARNNFPGGKWPPGLGKDDLTRIYERTAEEYEKPLARAGIQLAKQEAEIKQGLVDAMYGIVPTGPDHCRTLMGICQRLRSSREHEYLGAIKDAIELLGEDNELHDMALACWPEDLGQSDEA